MTDQQIINYYANLLILQYAGKPNAYSFIQMLVTPQISGQLVLATENAFELGTAVGVQLDVIGKYANVSRSGFGLYAPITLDDADFTQLIQMAIIKNYSGSDLSTIVSLIVKYFPVGVTVNDYQDMRMSYLFTESGVSFNLAQLFVSEGVLPKPMGVQLSATFLPSIANLFSFRTYTAPAEAGASPFNNYSSYQTDYPWLSYAEAIVL